MRSIVFVIAFFFNFASASFAQPPQTIAKGTTKISGRISIENQAAGGIDVILSRGDHGAMITGDNSPRLTTKTDMEGRYSFTNIAAGNYRISAYAPAFVITELTNHYSGGKALYLKNDETIENLNFTLKPGGVITGKVTDAAGEPVVEIMVSARRVDEMGSHIESFRDHSPYQWETDDRGEYRIYGLEPGRYKIAAGAEGVQGWMDRHRFTYHPSAAEESRAKIVEVKSGAETEAVDVVLASVEKEFAVSGRVVEADTAKPVTEIVVGYSKMENGSFTSSISKQFNHSNGEFGFDNLPPGSYQVFTNMGRQESDLYGEPVKFEITNEDVSGVEIKMRRGGSISGGSVIEGAQDHAALVEFSNIRVSAYPISSEIRMMSRSRAVVTPDGKFQLGGLRPGKIHLDVQTDVRTGLVLQRIEHNGNSVKEFDLNPGDRINSVRLVFVYGTGVITGQVEIKGGNLAIGMQMNVNLMRENNAIDNRQSVGYSEVDERGRFVIERLPQGNYKLMLTAWHPTDRTIRGARTEQMVTVSGNSKQEVKLVLDLTRKDQER